MLLAQDDPCVDALEERERGIRKARENKNIRALQMISGNTPHLARMRILQMLEDHPDIRGIFCTGQSDTQGAGLAAVPTCWSVLSSRTIWFSAAMKLVFSVSSCMGMLIIETSCSKLRWMLELMLKKRAFVKAFAPLTVSSEAYMDMENRAASIMMEKISVIFQLSFMEHSPSL